jgi:polyhydroxyalkanoate synthase
LILPPWINKYYVLDLRAENSLAAWLRDQGFTVYMVSWRSADETVKDFGWSDYYRLGASAALDEVRQRTGAAPHLAGYCVGGALAAVLAARLAAQSQEAVASLTLMAAQMDFSEPGDLGLFIDDSTLPYIRRTIEEAGGVMPGEAMRDAFNLLRPEELIWRHVEERYLLGEAPRAFDLLYWNADQTNLPGPLHMESLLRLYIDNALAKGAFEVDGATVRLDAITAPVFLHAARRDHISPFASVYKGAKLFGGPVEFVLADSGHIAGVVNPPATGKYRYWTNPEAAPDASAWLAGASEHAGSWWPLWADWLKQRSGNRTAPPPPVDGAPPAPGDYVRDTLASIRARRAG